MNWWKNLLGDTKVITSAGAVVIALALIWLINQRWQSTEEVLRQNTQALNQINSTLSSNTDITKQFQSLLLDISRDARLRSSLEQKVGQIVNKVN